MESSNHFEESNKQQEEREVLLHQLHDMMEVILQKNSPDRHYLRDVEHLGAGSMYVLNALYQKGVCRASDIAHSLEITSGAVTGLTDKLLYMGLIHRERSEEDRRVVLLSLSDQGRETYMRLRNARSERLKAAFSHVGTDEIECLHQILSKIKNQ
ncbi:MarR family winged helix-turn-helix transcriptional regulator [Paenibacillus terrigena]|uniref:MarR family winged helix-turn-helix transcriptional regulator n=1 Tax=Paenibacillus terrigena TaxID=369333 RepID=UPI000377C00B|nr:MarR family transcriptional regulator [Paenibacillus terrigena]